MVKDNCSSILSYSSKIRKSISMPTSASRKEYLFKEGVFLLNSCPEKNRNIPWKNAVLEFRFNKLTPQTCAMILNQEPNIGVFPGDFPTF